MTEPEPKVIEMEVEIIQSSPVTSETLLVCIERILLRNKMTKPSVTPKRTEKNMK